MGCGCKKKKNKTPAVQMQPAAQYEANGSPTVALGLKKIFPLPVRLPGAMPDGKDLVVVQNKHEQPSVPNSVVVIGYDAPVTVEDKAALVNLWPAAFEGGNPNG